MEIITPEHQRWPEFVRRLRNKMAEWDCLDDHRFACRALSEMGVSNPIPSIHQFIDYGCACDCEILEVIQRNSSL